MTSTSEPLGELSFAERERRTRQNRPRTSTLRSSFAVFLGQPTPRIILALAVASGVARAFAGPAVWWDVALVAATVVYWPFQEWVLHRWVLHIRPFRVAGRTIDLTFARRHREHHENPSEFGLVFLPWHIPLLAWLVFFVLLTLLLPASALRWTALTAVSFAALVYEWVHHMAHCDYRPRSRWMRRVWQNHRMHHYRNEQHWFAFTVPHIDEWFGTGGDAQTVETSETVRTLGVDQTGAT
jgi:hypothetical protein